MQQKLSRYALITLSILVMSVYLPMLYQKVFVARTGRTHLFYSPVIKKFVFREMIKDHRFLTQDETGRDLDRKTFESLIPFIPYSGKVLTKHLFLGDLRSSVQYCSRRKKYAKNGSKSPKS